MEQIDKDKILDVLNEAADYVNATKDGDLSIAEAFALKIVMEFFIDIMNNKIKIEDVDQVVLNEGVYLIYSIIGKDYSDYEPSDEVVDDLFNDLMEGKIKNPSHIDSKNIC